MSVSGCQFTSTSGTSRTLAITVVEVISPKRYLCLGRYMSERLACSLSVSSFPTDVHLLQNNFSTARPPDVSQPNTCLLVANHLIHSALMKPPFPKTTHGVNILLCEPCFGDAVYIILLIRFFLLLFKDVKTEQICPDIDRRCRS